jgi:hypothetical protein
MLRVLAAKLGRLKTMMEDPALDEQKKAKMEELRRRLEEEQQKASAVVTDLMGRLNTCDTATVEVTGEIATGTLIEICQVALFVTDPLKKVRVKLDRENGKLITENL